MVFIIVILSVMIGFFNSQTAAAYFAESKAVHETTLMAERAASQIELRSGCFAVLNERRELKSIIILISENLK
jgi:hypothetical protein